MSFALIRANKIVKVIAGKRPLSSAESANSGRRVRLNPGVDVYIGGEVTISGTGESAVITAISDPRYSSAQAKDEDLSRAAHRAWVREMAEYPISNIFYDESLPGNVNAKRAFAQKYLTYLTLQAKAAMASSNWGNSQRREIILGQMTWSPANLLRHAIGRDEWRAAAVAVGNNPTYYFANTVFGANYGQRLTAAGMAMKGNYDASARADGITNYSDYIYPRS